MNELEKIRSWNTLKESISKIYDIPTKRSYYKALLARAIQEWNFNPENPGFTPKEAIVPELDDWEKEFVQDITDSQTFGFNVRKLKQNQEFIQARRNMRNFINHGGTLKDIPEDIRTPHITNLYVTELLYAGDELFELADDLIKRYNKE